MTSPLPFARFAPPVSSPTPLRVAITAATRRDERTCLAALLPEATLPDTVRTRAAALAASLVTQLRARPRGNGIEQLVHEYALSSQEGVALMCLAEALLRIPDDDTRDALIRDKIAGGDWNGHVGRDRPLFVNAATWGLAVTGKLVGSVDERGLGAALTRLIARAGEPVIRRGVDLAMRLMGEHFVMGETIGEALRRARGPEAEGFLYSYDMLGEAAMTAADAARYRADYEAAIHAIGKAAAGRGPVAGPGISVKLSALHPRYARSQLGRVMGELLPVLRDLALLARGYGIGFNIDAEEADRLEISLDLLEALALDPALAGWDGLGFVVQAYGKRCPFVIDWIVDLARRSQRRIMVRLVKGAYWDAEIKRAQVDGQAGFPVYTRKVHTDVAYIACARRLLAAKDAVFPQFATHNAHTLATIHELAGPDFRPGDWEFQCLHGMGEPLYELVVGKAHLNRPCRIYAPVGTHETLLAYLVRRLLENGANSSFVNQIADTSVPVTALVADPVAVVASDPDPGAPHPLIALPRDILASRPNSAGLDLADEAVLSALSRVFADEGGKSFTAAPDPRVEAGGAHPVANPAFAADIVGTVRETTARGVAQAVTLAEAAAPGWAALPPAARADRLEAAAGLFQREMPQLMALVMREAGKSAANAVSEVREAIDFLRYYGGEARRGLAGAEPLGPIACISPWNFPLAIFTGQVAAALVAGNPVLAKPAEETPLTAARAVALLHEAGIPADVLQLVPGAGEVGAALVAHPSVQGVVFTGSTEVARLIQRELAGRLSPAGQPIPLIAETGGLNAMVVDSSALAEQVVADVVASAFDSAGQRCSALRVLCLQEDIAERTLAMLRGALAELTVGRTDILANDIGPVISAEARAGIERHVAAMESAGHRVTRLPLDPDTRAGHFVAPTIIELDDLSQIDREVFGPVLHIVRFRRDRLAATVGQVNAWGYGLTFGLHTRLDETVERVTAAARAGNLYVNRNMIGAVVGVQPFGGRGLSGTGPKAGGPLYLHRLVRGSAPGVSLGTALALPGPVGEDNRYALEAGNRILVRAAEPAIRSDIERSLRAAGLEPVAALPADRCVVAGDAAYLLKVQRELVDAPGALVPVFAWEERTLPFLGEERAISVNTTAAGGNATLMAVA